MASLHYVDASPARRANHLQVDNNYISDTNEKHQKPPNPYEEWTGGKKNVSDYTPTNLKWQHRRHQPSLYTLWAYHIVHESHIVLVVYDRDSEKWERQKQIYSFQEWYKMCREYRKGANDVRGAILNHSVGVFNSSLRREASEGGGYTYSNSLTVFSALWMMSPKSLERWDTSRTLTCVSLWCNNSCCSPRSTCRGWEMPG